MTVNLIWIFLQLDLGYLVLAIIPMLSIEYLAKSFNLTYGNIGPWWLSSGKHARLLLQQSEFESCWNLQFFSCKICVWKELK